MVVAPCSSEGSSWAQRWSIYLNLQKGSDLLTLSPYSALEKEMWKHALINSHSRITRRGKGSSLLMEEQSMTHCFLETFFQINSPLLKSSPSFLIFVGDTLQKSFSSKCCYSVSLPEYLCMCFAHGKGLPLSYFHQTSLRKIPLLRNSWRLEHPTLCLK